MFMIDYKDLGWRYWIVTAVFLSMGVAGYPLAFLLAIGLTIVHLVHFLLREKNASSFPVQVRICYLLLLLFALPEPLQLIFWIPCVGTWAQVIFGYCTMARIVSLFPWNRSELFSVKLVLKTFFSLPVRGTVKQAFSVSK